MNNAVAVSLVSYTYSQDAIGQYAKTETTKSVYATMRSCTQSEFYEAGRNGFQPEFNLVINSFEYSGEKEVIVNNKHYEVYRTYEKMDNRVELYCRKVGGIS